MRKRAAIFIGVLVALVLPAQALADEVLSNPSFEGTLTGWSGWNATLSLASDGVDGTYAAKATSTSTSTSYSINTSPRPSIGPKGTVYSGNGWVRASSAQKICLYLREWSSGTKIGSASRCITASSSWQPFPTVTWTSQGGTQIEEYVYASGVSKGAWFEVDGMSLDNGASSTPPPPDTTPPDTTITSGPADGSSTEDTTASFAFTSTESGTFQCALDSAAWTTCTSPQAYDSLPVGQHTFQVRAVDAAGNIDPSPASRTWTVTSPPPPPPPSSGDPSMLFVGDQHCADSVPGAFDAIAQVIGWVDPNGVDPIASLGDESGDQGTADEFDNCFDPVWAPFKARTHPAIGNHDWGTGNANGYFDYWGAAAGPRNQGWYSYDVGTWHIVVLSSYCGKVGGCGLGSPQVAWLKQDLAAHQTQCTLAYWHHPYFTSSPQPGTSGNTSGFWTTLYNYGADVIVNAHIHLYERFAPQNPSGQLDQARGIREFVVGTGGGAMVSWSSRAANSEVIQNSSFGILELTLHPGSYDWSFVPATGSFTDSGSGTCH